MWSTQFSWDTFLSESYWAFRATWLATAIAWIQGIRMLFRRQAPAPFAIPPHPAALYWPVYVWGVQSVFGFGWWLGAHNVYLPSSTASALELSVAVMFPLAIEAATLCAMLASIGVLEALLSRQGVRGLVAGGVPTSVLASIVGVFACELSVWYIILRAAQTEVAK